MKNHFLFLIVLCMITSCEVEDLPSSEVIEENFTTKSQQVNLDISYSSTISTSSVNGNHVNILENYAYYTGLVIKYDEQARNEFLSLKGLNPTVDLYDLLKPDTRAPEFRKRFIEVFIRYVNIYPGRPEGTVILPPDIDLSDPIIIDNLPDDDDDDDDDDNDDQTIIIDLDLRTNSLASDRQLFYATFNFLTSQNCTELYLPNNLKTNSGFHILTAGHPLNLDTGNNSIRILESIYETNHIDFGTPYPYAINSHISSLDYLAGENIIICRPKISATCVSTSGIPDIDYTLFIRNSINIGID